MVVPELKDRGAVEIRRMGRQIESFWWAHPVRLHGRGESRIIRTANRFQHLHNAAKFRDVQGICSNTVRSVPRYFLPQMAGLILEKTSSRTICEKDLVGQDKLLEFSVHRFRKAPQGL